MIPVLLLALTLAAEPPRTVDLTVASSQAALEGLLLVRLTQEGFVVYPKGRAGAVRLRIADLGTELRIEIEAAGKLRTDAVVVRGAAAEVQLEATQKAVELAHAAAAELEATPIPAPVAAPPPTPPPAPPPPGEEVRADNPWVVDLRLDLGLLSAPYLSAGPLVQVGLRVGRQGPAAHLIMGVMPPTGRSVSSMAPQLRGPSFVLQVGGGYRFFPVWRLELEPVLVTGYIRYDEVWSVLVLTPGLMLGVKVTDSIHLGLRALVGATLAGFANPNASPPDPPVYADTGLYLSFQFW